MNSLSILFVCCPLCLMCNMCSFSIRDTEFCWQRIIHRASATPFTMEQGQSEMNILSNGKSHNLGDDVDVPMKTSLEDDQWVFLVLHKHVQVQSQVYVFHEFVIANELRNWLGECGLNACLLLFSMIACLFYCVNGWILVQKWHWNSQVWQVQTEFHFNLLFLAWMNHTLWTMLGMK